MIREERNAIIARIKGEMYKTKGLTAAEIYSKVSADANLFSDQPLPELSVSLIEEALKEEAKDAFGIVAAPSKKGRKLKFTLKREKRVNVGKPETDASDTKKIGTGGEYLVLSELLFRGYEANIMSVDDGIDIVASKDNKIYFIQVKTTYLENNRISVSIPIASFERVRPHDVRYFIVIREGYGNAKILMLHQQEIITNAANGYIEKSDSNYNIKIEFRSDGVPVLYNNQKNSTIIQSALQEIHKFNL